MTLHLLIVRAQLLLQRLHHTHVFIWLHQGLEEPLAYG